MTHKRRTFSAEFKAKVALDSIKEGKTLSELCQLYQVHPNQVSQWKKEFLANASKVFSIEKDESQEIKRLKQEKQELIHQIGELTVDVNWLKKKLT